MELLESHSRVEFRHRGDRRGTLTSYGADLTSHWGSCSVGWPTLTWKRACSRKARVAIAYAELIVQGKTSGRRSTENMCILCIHDQRQSSWIEFKEGANNLSARNLRSFSLPDIHHDGDQLATVAATVALIWHSPGSAKLASKQRWSRPTISVPVDR